MRRQLYHAVSDDETKVNGVYPGVREHDSQYGPLTMIFGSILPSLVPGYGFLPYDNLTNGGGEGTIFVLQLFY